MKKQLVTSEWLASHITKELQKIEDCGDLIVHGIQQLRDNNVKGCNWSSELNISTGGVQLSHFKHQLDKIITDARSMFNLVAQG